MGISKKAVIVCRKISIRRVHGRMHGCCTVVRQLQREHIECTVKRTVAVRSYGNSRENTLEKIPKYVEHTVAVQLYGNFRENTSKTIPKYVERTATPETECNTVPMYVALC